MRPAGVAVLVVAVLGFWAFESVREVVIGRLGLAVVVAALLVAVPALGLHFMATRRRVLEYHHIPGRKAQRLTQHSGGVSSAFVSRSAPPVGACWATLCWRAC